MVSFAHHLFKSFLGNYVRKLEYDEVEFLANLKEEEKAKNLARRKHEESQLKAFKKEMEKVSTTQIIKSKTSKARMVDNQKKILSSVKKKKIVSLVSYSDDETE